MIAKLKVVRVLFSYAQISAAIIEAFTCTVLFAVTLKSNEVKVLTGYDQTLVATWEKFNWIIEKLLLTIEVKEVIAF